MTTDSDSGTPHATDRSRLRRQFPRPRVGLFGVPRGGRGLPAADRLRLRVAVGAAALRRPVRRRRDPADPPALRPHARRRATTSWSAGTPRTAPTRRCRSTRPAGAPERIAAAYGRRRARRRRLHLLRLQPGTFPIGPFTVTVDRVNHPVETYGVRLEHGGRVSLLVRHRALRRAAAAGPGRRPVPLRGQLPRRRGQPARPAPDRPGGRRDGDQGRRGPAAAHPPGGGLGQRGAHVASRPPPRTPDRSRWSGPAPATTSDRPAACRRDTPAEVDRRTA